MYGIVKRSGGYVWVESTPAEGTIFTMCLPEVEAPVEVTPARPSEPRLAAVSRTVLVIEDEEDGVRELAARHPLPTRTHRVLVAAPATKR